MSCRKFLKKYVDRFNEQDEELIIQHVSNREVLQWMEENIPLFECTDQSIEDTYYFR